MSERRRSGPLEEVTILDCSMVYSGPFGTALLADLGANVVKVEPPAGDPVRGMQPYPPDYHPAASPAQGGSDYGMAFAGVNRNKRSICLDLKSDDDRETFLKLCEQADAVVENMRAGVMDEMGLGYEVIARRNPRIVYGAIRGYGDSRTGENPYIEWPCLDVVGQSISGLVEATGGHYPIAISDIYPGTLMALGLVAAIFKARSSGKGEFFDVSMYEAGLSLLRDKVPEFSLTGQKTRTSSQVVVPFRLFPTIDGRIAIAAPVDKHWQLLCDIMDRADLINDERTRTNVDRSANQEFTEAAVAAWTMTKSNAEIVALLGGKVPCGPANTMADIFDDPYVAERGLLEEFQLPGNNPSIKLAASPIKFQHSRTGLYLRPPTLGEHSDEILEEFDLK